MPKPGYIDVDRLQAETTLEEAAAKCGVRLDPKTTGKEARIDCPFHCPGDHTGRREVSVSLENPQKVFYCHAYQCQIRGNLLTLMYGWLTGNRPEGDKLKGGDFNRVKRVLAGIDQIRGQVAETIREVVPSEEPVPPKPPPARAIPLEESDDAAMQALATLDEKLVRDVGRMHPAAASYVRRHPCLSPESMAKWRVGYLPLDGGGDKRGWSLRGHILYPLLSEQGKVLAWIGRDPAFEEKEREFLALVPEEREKRRAPSKHKVPSGFARGGQFFGQHAARLDEPGYREFIREHGIVVVEGFNDVIGLDNLGIPSLGLCSNRMTEAQADKLARWSARLSGGKVTLLLDCDEGGDAGAKEALWMLAQRKLNVRLAWTKLMHEGQFSGMQPEFLENTHGHLLSLLP